MSLFNTAVRFLYVLIIVSAIGFLYVVCDPKSYGLDEWWSEYRSAAKKVTLTLTYLAWGYVIYEEF